jgi:[ribosomal protein S5]-alanine N-acetyltransferase
MAWLRGVMLLEMVRVEPVTAAWVDALAQGDQVFSRQFGVRVEPDWAPFPEVIPWLREAARSPRSAEWGPHLLFDDDGALVGSAGWKGEAVDGVAELGYAVAPARQGRGIATAVVHELLRRARHAGVRQVIAHTRPERSPSTSVLARCGFRKVDEVVDPADGPVWRWGISLGDG